MALQSRACGLQEPWYEKLNRWDEALEAYERKYAASRPGSPAHVAATLGRCRCDPSLLSSSPCQPRPAHFLHVLPCLFAQLCRDIRQSTWHSASCRLAMVWNRISILELIAFLLSG